MSSVSAAIRPLKVLDGTDYYLAPLLTDSHIHIRSTMLTPGQLDSILLPKKESERSSRIPMRSLMWQEKTGSIIC